MDRMKRTEFAALMTRLRTCYQNHIADESLWLASITTYWDVCRGYPPEDIRAAFSIAWRRYPDWMPSCGQLLGLIERAPSTRAAEAWPEVLRLATRSSSEHSDPIAAEAIQLMGGGGRLGRMRSDELHVWGRKEFMERYADVARRVETDAVRRRLKAREGPSSAVEGPAQALPPGGQ